MERAVGKNEKLEKFKLESFRLSWKEPSEVGKNEQSWKEPSKVEKNRAKLERAERSWKVVFLVGKFR